MYLLQIRYGLDQSLEDYWAIVLKINYTISR